MAEQWLVFFGLMATVAAGVFIIVRGLKHREQSLELAHRERMAMIEKGIVPSPEMNPGHPAWAMGRDPDLPHHRVVTRHDVGSQRSLTLGIVIVAIGFGFMTLIGIAAESPQVAIGIGGAIVIVGIAFIVISLTKRSVTVHTQGPSLPGVRPPANAERPPDLPA